jgi:hypothetical protein
MRHHTGFTVFRTVAINRSLQWHCGGGIQVQDDPNSGLNETNAAANKLKRIRKLWEELAQTKLRTVEYQAIMKRIRALSAEYQVLVDASEKPEKSERVITPVLDGHPE